VNAGNDRQATEKLRTRSLLLLGMERVGEDTLTRLLGDFPSPFGRFAAIAFCAAGIAGPRLFFYACATGFSASAYTERGCGWALEFPMTG